METFLYALTKLAIVVILAAVAWSILYLDDGDF